MTKTHLFLLFLGTFCGIALVPQISFHTYVLDKTEAELKSSLNQEYHLMTEQIARTIDDGYIRRWIQGVDRLQSMIQPPFGTDETGRTVLLETFFTSDPEVISVSYFEPGQEPVHLFKGDEVEPLFKTDPEGLRRLFTPSDTGPAVMEETVRVEEAVMFTSSGRAFLPLSVKWEADDGKGTCRIRCVYPLSPILKEVYGQFPIGKKQMFIINRSGATLCSSDDGASCRGEPFDYPVRSRILEGIQAKNRLFQMETFSHDARRYVGSYATTRTVDWAVVIIEPYESAYAWVFETRGKILFWVGMSGGLSLGISLLFSWFFSRFIVRAEAALISAKEAAEAADKFKSEFLAMVSHEIRTPMSAVIGISDLLITTPLSSEQKEFVRTIQANGKELLYLLNDLLDFSKIESGKMELVWAPFELGAAVEEVLLLTSSQAYGKGVELIHRLDSETPDYIVGDALRLKQILKNLTANAVKFTQSGEIAIHVAAPHSTDKGHLIHFTVKDTGIGISAEDQERIFAPYAQAGAATSHVYGGTGLGLSISRRLVELMGGTLWVESAPGQGACFHFTIETPRHVMEPKGFMHRNITRFRGKTVLLIEKNKSLADALAARLEYWGLTVQKEHAFRTASPSVLIQPDLLILDEASLPPDVNDLLLEAEVHMRKAPVILLTRLGIEDRKARIEGPMPIFTLTKPIRTARLFDAVSRGLTPPDTAATPIRLDEDEGLLADRYPLSILLVDDNPVNQVVATGLFKHFGYSIRIARNGEEALTIMGNHPRDLVFMDVHMPGINGFEATRRIRETLPDHHQPVVIALTASSAESDRESCLAAGMDDFIVKPISSTVIRSIIEKWHPACRKESSLTVSSPILDMDRLETIREVGRSIEPEDCDGSAFLSEILTAYFDEAPRLIDRIKTFSRQGLLSDVSFEAHALRSMCVNIGAAKLAGCCGIFIAENPLSSPVDVRHAELLLEKTFKETTVQLKKLMEPLS